MKSIAVIGCGPAGLSAAIALYDAGYQVTLFEQFEQPAPVGSGLMLQPTGLRVLEHWGLREAAEKLGQRIDGMLGRVASNGKVVLDINYSALPKTKHGTLYGIAIHRAALFDVLYNAVMQRNIAIVTGQLITSTSSTSSNRHQLINEHIDTLNDAFDLVVDASGSRSKLVEHYGFGEARKNLAYGALWTTVELNDPYFTQTLLEQRYQGAGVMVGVLPCGHLPDTSQALATFFWSIKDADFAAFKSAGLDAWKSQVLKIWPQVASLLDSIGHIDQLTHATYTHHTLTRPYAPGIVFIGDAAHATSPQLGQGANMAFLDAYALAAALKCSDDNSIDFAKLYTKARRRHVRLFQAASYLLTPFYQSDSRLLPTMRDTFFEPVSKLPLSAELVTALGSGLMTNPVATIDKTIAQAKKAARR